MASVRVSLVIPTWNAGPLLEEVLAAVARQPGAADLEKVAVDSGSTDGTLPTLERHGFQVIHVPQREFGHGATRDLAIDRTSGEIVLLLTQDATPIDDRWLPALVKAYEDPEVAAAYCRQVPRPDCNPLMAQRIAEWSAGRDQPRIQRLPDGARLQDLSPMDQYRLSAYDNVAGSVRRTAWDVHRFGPRDFGEDIGFGKKLIEAGLRIAYQPRAAVLHSHNRQPKEEGKRIYCDHKNLKELFGLHLIPTWRHCRQCITASQRQYRKIVDGLGLGDREKAALHRWAREYARWSALGTYLGGNADRLGTGWCGWLFRRLDKHLRKGI